MIEFLYIKREEDVGLGTIIDENIISNVFNSELDVDSCAIRFNNLIAQKSHTYLKIDEEVYYLSKNKEEDTSYSGPFFLEKQENDVRIIMFGMGLIEIEEYRIDFKRRMVYNNDSIELFISKLMSELSNMSEEYKIGFSIIIYINIKNSKYIIFGRDQQGDSSLLLSIGEKGREFLISNLKSDLIPFNKKPQSIEIPISGLFMFDANNSKFSHYKWNKLRPYLTDNFWNYNELNSTPIKEDSNKLLSSLRSVFLSTIGKKFTFIKSCDNKIVFSYIGLMFSGGLDSSLLFYMLLEWLFDNKIEIEKEIINFVSHSYNSEIKVYFIVELLNTTFVPKEAPDRITGLSSYYDIMNIFRDRIKSNSNVSIRFICVDNDGIELTKQEKHILNCIYPCNTHLDFNIGGALYFCLKGHGFLLNYDSFNEEWWNSIISTEKKDSEIWDGIFEEKVDDIEIIGYNEDSLAEDRNIKKEDDHKKNEINSNKNDNNKLIKKCPYCSFKEHSKCQNRCCKSCCRKIQQFIITDTIYPVFTACRIHKMKNSDLSSIPSTQRCIDPNHYYLKEPDYAKILFEGEYDQNNNVPIFTFKNGKQMYIARSRYILIGSGADEFLGGYGRHKTARKYNGLLGIKKEMLFDISRLWIRNLGRDYRIALYNGRTLFAPFLQYSVISTIGQLNFNNISGSEFEFTKPILRYIARTLGMKYSPLFKKRAVQFGTRSSRQTNLKHFDSNRKASADSIYIPVNY
ncbi:asparagine synthetase B like [Cryptosporidium xiaoi]|uniref:Asparagine synthetase B like n=1 Tax=Cryptosporidium xiaoi TaxID=659607 RepID=A0AAV9XXK9_9CRYT